MTGGKTGALLAGIAAMVVAVPLMVVILFLGMKEPAAACETAPPGGPVPSGDVRIVQANIPMRSNNFGGSLRKLTALEPDFISLNEVPRRSKHELTPRGYSMFRGPATKPVGQTRSTAVLWRSEEWTKVDAGRVLMVAKGPQKWDAGRSATWVRLRKVDGTGEVTFVSLHHMINARKFGPNKPKRRQLYRQGLQKVIDLDPTFVAGDFNSRYGDNDPWGPRRVLGSAGLKSSREVLGNRDGSVDYIFHQRSTATPVKQGASRKIASDHPMVWADYELGGKKRATGGDQSAPKGGGDLGLNADQLKNARLLVSKGIAAGGKPAALVGVTTALTESGLHTDPGSLGGAYGLMQQTPPYWGTKAQVMNPKYAVPKFYSALMQVPGWQTMEPWHAAQMVQKSGAGDVNDNGVVDAGDGKPNYGPEVKKARRIVAALGGNVIDEATDGCPEDGDGAPVDAGKYGKGGNFSPPENPHVGPFSRRQLLARMEKFIAANGSGDLDPFFHSQSGSWLNACQHFAANLSGRAYSGYASATVGWSTMVSRGVAHRAGSRDGMSPPVGAWLYYDNSGPYGHVVVYLGNNQVAGTDTWGKGTVNIGPASDLTNGKWNLDYLGWSAPWGRT